MTAPAFTDTPREAARAFRAALDAMARPGRIVEIAGPSGTGLSPAAAALVLTLADRGTGIWLAPALDTPGLRGWITFHTGAGFTAPEGATFALGPWEEIEAILPRLPAGQPDYPDRSATLIVERESLSQTGARLTGPGIRDSARLSLPDSPAFAANAAAFPCGLDFFFTCGGRLAALPRTTRVEVC